jgi:hypothetical protein
MQSQLTKYFVIGAVLLIITIAWVCSITWGAIQGGLPWQISF